MKVNGIEFTHRRARDDRSFVSKDYAEFTAFASLLAAEKVNHLVKSVFYDKNICSFEIFCDEELFYKYEGGVIDWCANKTLSQYILFGYCQHKNDLDEEHLQ